jgi:hypothetical protein
MTVTLSVLSGLFVLIAVGTAGFLIGRQHVLHYSVSYEIYRWRAIALLLGALCAVAASIGIGSIFHIMSLKTSTPSPTPSAAATKIYDVSKQRIQRAIASHSGERDTWNLAVKYDDLQAYSWVTYPREGVIYQSHSNDDQDWYLIDRKKNVMEIVKGSLEINTYTYHVIDVPEDKFNWFLNPQ